MSLTSPSSQRRDDKRRAPGRVEAAQEGRRDQLERIERAGGALRSRIEALEQRVSAQVAAQEALVATLSRQAQEDRKHRRRVALLERELDRSTTAKRLLEKTDFAPFYEIAEPVVRSGRTLLGYDRLYVLWQAVRNSAALALPAAEIGSYRAAPQRSSPPPCAISEASSSTCTSSTRSAAIRASACRRSTRTHIASRSSGTPRAEEVASYLSAFEHVEIHVGNALELLRDVEPLRFSLVHLDVDLYLPTAACLEFFGRRLAPGGVVVVDDFNSPKCPGVRKAVDEFLDGDPSFRLWQVETKQVVLVKMPVPASDAADPGTQGR